MTKRLGRGLADLIESAVTNELQTMATVRTDQVKSGKFQPRVTFDEAALEELKASIKRQGIIQPILVRPAEHDSYELIAGERRWRAAQALGIAEIPAIVLSLSDKEALEYSLIENVQRANLNPVEEAKGYARLLNEFGYTQEDVASAVGKDRVTIANLLRLLNLPGDIQDAVGRGAISVGHAKVLLSVEHETRQVALSQRAIRDGLSVRALEVLAGAWMPARRRAARRDDPQLKSIEQALRTRLGTKVTLMTRKKGGRVLIEYFSSEDLDRILQALGVSTTHAE